MCLPQNSCYSISQIRTCSQSSASVSAGTSSSQPGRATMLMSCNAVDDTDWLADVAGSASLVFSTDAGSSLCRLWVWHLANRLRMSLSDIATNATSERRFRTSTGTACVIRSPTVMRLAQEKPAQQAVILAIRGKKGGRAGRLTKWVTCCCWDLRGKLVVLWNFICLQWRTTRASRRVCHLTSLVRVRQLGMRVDGPPVTLL